MMAWLGATFVAVVFLAVIFLFRLGGTAKKTLVDAQSAMAIIRDKELSEEEKERQTQRLAFVLMSRFLWLSLGGLTACLLPFAILWGAEQLVLVSVNEVLATLVSIEFLATSTVLGILLATLLQQRPNHA